MDGARRRPTGRAPVRRPPVAAAWLLAPALLLSCAGPGAPQAPGPVLLAERPERSEIDPAFLPAFDALGAAVEDGEDDLARRILALILARDPPEHLREFAAGYERILDGRALAGELDLRLVSEPVAGSAADFRLLLEAGHGRAGEVRLRLPPAGLRRTLTAIDAAGNESRSLTTELSPALERLVVAPGERVRVKLLDYELELGGALALRERWTLETRAGVFLVDGRELPAQDVDVQAVERTRLAAFLPAAPVEPAELVRYLEGDALFMPALIERAVRIAPERREEALDLLTPVVLRLERERPERLEACAPALRWLARTGRQGNAPTAWAAWFAARRASAGDPARGLDVPAEPGKEGEG